MKSLKELFRTQPQFSFDLPDDISKPKKLVRKLENKYVEISLAFLKTHFGSIIMTCTGNVSYRFQQVRIERSWIKTSTSPFVEVQ